MLQIIKNYLFILILPLIVGFLIRFLIRKTKFSFLPTVIFTVIAIVKWIISFTVDTGGSEMLGIQAVIVTAIAVSSAVTGLILRLIKNKKA